MKSVYFPSHLIRDLMQAEIIKIDYEAILELCYKKWVQKGDSVVDIGAHNGRHLGELVKCVGECGKVMGFEPLSEQFENLVLHFSQPTVQLFNVALCNNVGTSQFTFAQGDPEQSGLRERIFCGTQNPNPKQITVNTQRLDSYIEELNALSYIKIDVEGSEIECLNGAKNVLKRYRPLVSVEYGEGSYSVYGNNEFSLYDFSESSGYVLYDIFLNRLADRDLWRISVDSIFYDFFMVPLERENFFLEKVRPDHFLNLQARVLKNGIPLELYEKVRLPNDFDPIRYLELNPDVRDAGVSAREHYLEYGIFEGRVY